MQGTGRDYGLEVNNNVDERYHIEKATRALRKVIHLYKAFKDPCQFVGFDADAGVCGDFPAYGK